MKLSILAFIALFSFFATAQTQEVGGSAGPVSMSGDVTNTSATSVVLRISGNRVASGTPTNNYVLTYNSVATQWEPRLPLASLPTLTSTRFWVGNTGGEPVAVASSGDATFNGSGAFKVGAIQGVAVSTASPSDTNVLAYNSATAKWAPQQNPGPAHMISIGSAPTALVNANAGDGATCTVANATDTAGIILVTEVVTGPVYPASGDMCTLTFHTAYSSAPNCVISEAAAPTDSGVTDGAYAAATTTTLTLGFIGTDFTLGSYVHTYSYICIGNQ